MDFFRILLTSILSFAVLFILTKLMGNRQMSQLSLFDYVTGITIGSIAADLAISLEDEMWPSLVAMVIYALATIGVSMMASKSLKARRAITGQPKIIYHKGKLYDSMLKNTHIDMGEFMTQCRINGYFNIADIDTAILEPNGKISFLPLSERRPVTPEDLKLSPSPADLPASVIMDGVILPENLKGVSKDENWLHKQLKQQGVENVKDVFFASCDASGNLSLYMRQEDKPKDILE